MKFSLVSPSGQQVHSYGRTVWQTSPRQYEPDDSNLLISYVWNIEPSAGLELTQGFEVHAMNKTNKVTHL